MEKITGQEFHLYKDMKERTGGEIYIGVVGPVRTGKSTFIRRFMELCVIPYLEDESVVSRTTDELPQAAQGKTVMTTEPKFIPAKAAKIRIDEDSEIAVRLIDCVGYMVEGAQGHLENGEERMVMTPWYDVEIPFTKAARIGTQKVIREHSTLGVVLTSDGSITDLPREAYVQAEKETIQELKGIGKPFVVILNSKRPFSDAVRQLTETLSKEYQTTVLPINVEQMRKEDMLHVLETLLCEFPVTKVSFYIPRWTFTLPAEHKVKKCLIEHAKKVLEKATSMRAMEESDYGVQPEDYVSRIQRKGMNYALGEIDMEMEVPEKYYYENISDLTGEEIRGEYELIQLIKSLAAQRKTFESVSDAMNQVARQGYGVITPQLTEIEMEEPQLVKHGSKYGIRLKAVSPSIHLIRANIETEIAPIIGTKEQAEGLIEYIREGKNSEDGVWSTNIFGKSVGELVEDGIRDKIRFMDEESQMKLQETMQKIVNDSNGGMVCIII